MRLNEGWLTIKIKDPIIFLKKHSLIKIKLISNLLASYFPINNHLTGFKGLKKKIKKQSLRIFKNIKIF